MHRGGAERPGAEPGFHLQLVSQSCSMPYYSFPLDLLSRFLPASPFQASPCSPYPPPPSPAVSTGPHGFPPQEAARAVAQAVTRLVFTSTFSGPSPLLASALQGQFLHPFPPPHDRAAPEFPPRSHCWPPTDSPPNTVRWPITQENFSRVTVMQP